MVTKLILPIMVSIIPIVIYKAYFLSQNKDLIKYFVPRFLPDKEHSRKTLRQAGAGFIFLSAWLVGIMASVGTTVDPKILEQNMKLMALMFFILPIFFVMFLFIGLYYLTIGIFAKSDNIRPRFKSVFSADKADLAKYIKWLKFYTVINLSFLFMAILSVATNIVFEKNVGERLIPFNVFFLIGFILTLWRVRAYITKAAIAMELSGEKYFLTTLFHPMSVFFVWFNSFKLIKMFKSTNKNVLQLSMPD
ncbi:MAG: hypothetical protein JW947_10385 [Sedimentisphaerales bacterium]|nr:hypothetical protein [Sedimentisphaerales bacterium]